MSELFGVEGKVALVTGASSGIGYHMSRTLARHGASVAVAARRVGKLDKLCDEIRTAGGQAHPWALDVTDIASFRGVIEGIEASLGTVDILVNNAGVARQIEAVEITEEDYDTIMDVNAKAAYFVAQSVARRMIEQKRGGSIINIASLNSLRVVNGLSVYAMSKAAIDQMTRSMAREWLGYGIRVNAILPGYIRTEMNYKFFDTDAGKEFIDNLPRKRVGAPVDLDGPLLLLASDASRFMTGSSILVDDGQIFGV